MLNLSQFKRIFGGKILFGRFALCRRFAILQLCQFSREFSRTEHLVWVGVLSDTSRYWTTDSSGARPDPLNLTASYHNVTDRPSLPPTPPQQTSSGMDVGYHHLWLEDKQMQVLNNKKGVKKVIHFKGKILHVRVDLIWSLAIDGIDNQYRKTVWALSEKSFRFPCCRQRRIKVQTFLIQKVDLALVVPLISGKWVMDSDQ